MPTHATVTGFGSYDRDYKRVEGEPSFPGSGWDTTYYYYNDSRNYSFAKKNGTWYTGTSDNRMKYALETDANGLPMRSGMTFTLHSSAWTDAGVDEVRIEKKSQAPTDFDDNGFPLSWDYKTPQAGSAIQGLNMSTAANDHPRDLGNTTNSNSKESYAFLPAAGSRKIATGDVAHQNYSIIKEGLSLIPGYLSKYFPLDPATHPLTEHTEDNKYKKSIL